MQFEHLHNISIDPVPSLYKFHTTVDVLRLDKIDFQISGNKWFKLKNYLAEATSLNKNIVLTYGGPYSNHILATAAASKNFGFKCIGIIRGEKPAILSATLQDALALGMSLYFLDRKEFSEKHIPEEVKTDWDINNIYFINEGGYGLTGAKGASEILKYVELDKYTHIIAATGTGTMLAGLIMSATLNQEIIGISVLKNNFSIQERIKELLPLSSKTKFKIIHDYSFGGYAKKNNELLNFMNSWFVENQIPSDFVYTGKLFYAVNDLVRKGSFSKNCKILIIHSGGLQGNRSLKTETLIF